MRIVIGTGGTGGHLFPALKVADCLKEDGHEVFFIGAFGVGVEKIKAKGYRFLNHDAIGLKSGFSNTLRSSSKMFGAFFSSIGILRELNPQRVLGFGGYGSFPVVAAAVILRIPTIIHEQNVLPGRANKMLAFFVNKIAISFKKSQDFLGYKKTVLTGCPCHFTERKVSKEQILKDFGLDIGKVTLLVFGGSQGSHRINQVFVEMLGLLKDSLNCQVIHACGKKDVEELKVKYQQLNVPFALFSFIDNIEDAYAVADCVISRAGAGTVTEIALHQIPAVLIPYPFAYGHQKENAYVLSEVNLARVIEEENLSVETLKEAIVENLKISTPVRIPDQVCFPDAEERLAREVISLK